jgi:CheY-like chemotaxis protein
VLFLSAYDEIEDKLKGYEAGGDDYLTKPYNIREVISKVNATLTFRETNRRRIEEATLVTHAVLSYNAELGMVIEFLKASFGCDSYYAVANLLLKTLAEFGLKASVQLRGKYEVVNLTGDGVVCSPLEAELLTKLNHKQRIVTFNTHTSFYFDVISLIVKNMPIEDQAKSSRIQEHIASLITGAQARIQVLNVELAQQHSLTAKMDNELNALQMTFTEVKDQFNEHEKQTSAIMDDLLTNINEAFEQQQLTPAQQDFFIRLTNNSMEKIVAHYASGTQIEKHLVAALKRLRQLVF